MVLTAAARSGLPPGEVARRALKPGRHGRGHRETGVLDPTATTPNFELLPLLLGEANPYYAGDDGMALYPLPRGASGHRLMTLLGLSVDDYLRLFDRANLCRGVWATSVARVRAVEVLAEGRPVVVTLGARVARALGCEFRPHTVQRSGNTAVAVLPHPSGRSRHWSEPHAVERARQAVARARSTADALARSIAGTSR